MTWRRESARHALARKGIKTGKKAVKSLPPIMTSAEEVKAERRILKMFKKAQREYKPLPKPKKDMKLGKGTWRQKLIFGKAWAELVRDFPGDAKRIHSVAVTKSIMSGTMTLNPGHVIIHSSEFTDVDNIKHLLQHEAFHIRTIEAGLSLEEATSFKMEFAAAAYSGKDFDEFIKDVKKSVRKK